MHEVAIGHALGNHEWSNFLYATVLIIAYIYFHKPKATLYCKFTVKYTSKSIYRLRSITIGISVYFKNKNRLPKMAQNINKYNHLFLDALS